MPSSLVIVDGSGNEEELVGKAAQADVFNGASTLISPVAFANNSVTFTLAYNHAEVVFASFQLG